MVVRDGLRRLGAVVLFCVLAGGMWGQTVRVAVYADPEVHEAPIWYEETLALLTSYSWVAVEEAGSLPPGWRDDAKRRGVSAALLITAEDDALRYRAYRFDTEEEVFDFRVDTAVSSPLVVKARLSPLKEALDGLDARFRGVHDLATKGEGMLVVEAVPGTLLEGIFTDPVEVGEEGVIRFRLPAPSTYVVRGLREGYTTEETVAVLRVGEETRVVLPQERVVGVVTGVNLQYFQFPGWSIMYEVVPDWFSAGGGVDWYGVGLYLPERPWESDRQAGFVSFALIEPWIGLRTTFIRWRSGVSLFGAMRVFLRVVYPEGLWGIDPVAPGGVVLGSGIRLPLSRRWAMVVEGGLSAYMTKNRLLFYEMLGEEAEQAEDIARSIFRPGMKAGVEVTW
ncbi:hypothetical protein [Spirochaeta thermophila]|uniref:Uncharacterized protein n=1 Tax=Winmispira thermophila (strain ATCC 49972 / DSM 6192 / RI 19.B1) TaxID=665571 RepID=E0RU30_WINT6|nr:hypothetical protein [Spirochaeta thermophila]ADN01086.1 hypothetical protein STHERM_c01100 [Spirochaeta thermophila DSM 6192]